MTKKRVLVVTHFPSPYQAEFLNSIARRGLVSLSAAYLHATWPTRSWKMPELSHEHFLLDGRSEKYAEVERLTGSADLVVFTYYQDERVLKLIARRAAGGRAWCFWGERPGFKGLGRLGALYRRWKLAALHGSDAPVWGIGRWAVEQYVREFGKRRLYFNVPYYSDLGRFRRNSTASPREGQRTFLFSGSLIRRKGVDLLAHAFGRLAAERSDVNLKIIGEGELRPELEAGLAPWRDRVQFVGFQDWGELPALYQTAGVLCVPSRYDGWNLVVPEGLAAGLPVIGTDRTGAAIELIEPGRNGWLVAANDADALYRAMSEAASLPPGVLRERALAAEASVLNHDVADGVNRFHRAVEGTLRGCTV